MCKSLEFGILLVDVKSMKSFDLLRSGAIPLRVTVNRSVLTIKIFIKIIK